MSRILAIDPGQVRIGIAISDPTCTIARPLMVLQHVSRLKDARSIVQIATQNEVEMILIGVALDLEGEVGPQARKALRLIDVLKEETNIPIAAWDESGSTQAAQKNIKNDDMLDARAAAVILQEYLDEQKR